MPQDLLNYENEKVFNELFDKNKLKMKSTHMMPLCRHAFYTKDETRQETNIEETPLIMTTENVKVSKSSNIQVKEMQIDTKKPHHSSPGINSESPVPANYDMGQENYKPSKSKTSE